MTHLEAYEANKVEIDFWISQAVQGNTPKLEISNDMFQPFIEPFSKENPTVNLYSCKDCVIDMLIWVKAQYNKGKKK